MTIRFTIHGEPCSKANSRQIVNFGKRPAVIKSKKARDYERDARRQIPSGARIMLAGPVRVTLRIFYASERPDLDESVILDVLQPTFEKIKGPLTKISDDEYCYGPSERKMVTAGVYLNDRQVREKHVYHAIDRANPRAEIEVEPLEPQQLPMALPEELEAVPF